jgi:hypothetical protein
MCIPEGGKLILLSYNFATDAQFAPREKPRERRFSAAKLTGDGKKVEVEFAQQSADYVVTAVK